MPDQVPLSEAITDPNTRKGIFLGMAVSAAQVFCGSTATVAYSSSMFASVSFFAAVIPYLPAFGSLLSVVLTLPALRLVETQGRRKLLLKTYFICVAADYLFIIFSVVSQYIDGAWASYAFGITFLLYGIGYNLGAGPVAYFLPGELVTIEASSASLGAAVAVNWISTLFTTLIYYPLNVAVGGWSYLLFALPSTVFFIIMWRYLPETKRKTEVENEEDIIASQLEMYGTFR